MKEKLKKIFSFDWMSKKFWIRLFLTQISVTVSLKIFGVSYVSDTFALGAMGFISALIGVHAWKGKTEKTEAGGKIEDNR